jgi:PAS domain S-box-containing protein
MMKSDTSTILIVDDDRGGREALEALLLTQGYNLILASNGPDALRILNETQVDLILLDVMMAHMDGYEVCRRIRANPGVADVPVLMLTALNDYRSRLAGFEAGADDYISKPYDSTELFARVRTITRLNRYRRLVAERMKFQQLFALSPNGQIVADSGGIVHLINQKMLELLNINAVMEIEGSPLVRWIEENQRQELQSIFEKCQAEPSQSFRLETGLIRPDSQYQPVELLLGRVEYNGQSMIQVIVIDIRERLQMAGALSREKILLRTLVDSLPDYFFVKDMESRILMANSAFACLFGFDSPEDMVGKTDRDIYPVELAERYLTEEKQVLVTGKPILDREEPLIDAHGNWLVFSTTKVPLYSLKNEVIGLMGIGRDVSRQINILRDQDGLKAQQKAASLLVEGLKQDLAEKEKEKRRVEVYLSKQLGNLAQQILAELSSPDQTGLLSNIREYSCIIQELADDVREFASLEAGEKSPDNKLFSITERIQSVVDRAFPVAAKKGLAIQVETNRPVPERVFGDCDSLERVIGRLLKHAIRITPTGDIRLSAGIENYNLVEPGSQLIFHAAVSDCGRAIPKKDMPAFFLPFHSPASDKNAADGLGLDLAICRALVQRAGGGIWAENKDEPDAGSIIHFSYPLAAV